MPLVGSLGAESVRAPDDFRFVRNRTFGAPELYSAGNRVYQD
jgi:hypothetical protein